MRRTCQKKLSLCSPDTGPIVSPAPQGPQERTFAYCAVCFALYLFSQPTEKRAFSYLKEILEVKTFSV